MGNNELVVWQPAEIIKLPKKIEFSEMITYGMQLSSKDQIQIIKAFELESYEMVSTYVWTKSINVLRSQLSKMGMSFIGEMLDRPDINDHSNLQHAISEYEAIKLAEELGVINGTIAFRLKQAMETVSHFSQPDLDSEDPENELTEEEAKTIIRSCIQGILGHTKIEAAIDFKNFRIALEETTLTKDNSYVLKLFQSPYFFHRTTIRILLAIIKSSNGAHLENSLANANLIIPEIWGTLKHPERYQVGRSYSEMHADGKNRAASGLRQVLLKIKGFDFVPEDLRSTSFVKVANEILIAHENMNNFYNEPMPTTTLSKMGSVIPIPAFSICMTAVLSVKLGNSYGISRAAQSSAESILKNVTPERWIYFFNECLQTNERILYKLTINSPSTRWIEYIRDSNHDFENFISEIKDKDIQNLLAYTIKGKRELLNRISLQLYTKIGYANS